MSSDYKYDIAMEAEAIAENEYGMDFYKLPAAIQSKVYERGMDAWRDKQLGRADYLNDVRKEQGR